MNTTISRFVEQLGVLMDDEGYPRVCGQLLGLLIMSPEPQSLDDLGTALQVSKASISINIRALEQKGVVERVGVPGDRRDYYRVAEDLLGVSIEQRVAKWQRFHDVIRAARKAPSAHTRAVRTRLHELDMAYEHMIGAMSGTLKSWRHQRATASKTATKSARAS